MGLNDLDGPKLVPNRPSVPKWPKIIKKVPRCPRMCLSILKVCLNEELDKSLNQSFQGGLEKAGCVSSNELPENYCEVLKKHLRHMLRGQNWGFTIRPQSCKLSNCTTKLLCNIVHPFLSKTMQPKIKKYLFDYYILHILKH